MDEGQRNDFGGLVGEGPAFSVTKKPKKFWWWVLAGIVALIVVLVLILILVRNGGFSAGKEGYKETFNKYANYFLYGEDSNSEIMINDFSEEDSYFYEKFESLTLDSEYFSRLVSLFDLFKEKYDALEERPLSDVIDEYVAKLYLVNTVYQNSPLTMALILESYLEGGEMAATAAIDEKTRLYQDITDIYNISYYAYMKDFGRKNLELIEEYESMGCMAESGINYSCAAELNNERVDSISQSVSEDARYMRAILNNSKEDLVTGIFNIRDGIYDNLGVNSNEND